MLKRLLICIGFLVFVCGCTCRVPVSPAVAHARMDDVVTLYHRPLDLHLSRPASSKHGDILVVYATGDGGWHGLSREIFGWMSAWGYPVAGFSSRNYLKNLAYASDSDTTTPRRLVRDLRNVIVEAKRVLGLAPDTKVILAGLSRGAGLMVVAGGQRELQPDLAGVLAIALTREEEHVVRYRTVRGEPRPRPPKLERVEIRTYEYLRRLATIPVSVIQSTRDGYLPAVSARTLFGPDTDLRKFHPVEARNHSFCGGCTSLRDEVRQSLDWIEGMAHGKPVSAVTAPAIRQESSWVPGRSPARCPLAKPPAMAGIPPFLPAP